LADLSPSNLQESQPRRIGTASNLVAPLWRSDGTVLAVGPQGDGLALRAVDIVTGKVQDLAAQLPPTAGQASGIAARWDLDRGRMLLLSHAATTVGITTHTGVVQAWLVSFVPVPAATPR